MLINLPRKSLLGRFNFKGRVRDLQFSPCGRFVAVTHGKQLHVWVAPGASKQFAPMRRHRKYVGHYNDLTCLCWSHDSRFIATGSADNTCRVFSRDPIEGYVPVALTAHRDRIVGLFFAKGGMDLYTVSRDGTCLVWRSRLAEAPPVEEEGDSGSGSEAESGDESEAASGSESEGEGTSDSASDAESEGEEDAGEERRAPQGGGGAKRGRSARHRFIACICQRARPRIEALRWRRR